MWSEEAFAVDLEGYKKFSSIINTKKAFFWQRAI